MCLHDKPFWICINSLKTSIEILCLDLQSRQHKPPHPSVNFCWHCGKADPTMVNKTLLFTVAASPSIDRRATVRHGWGWDDETLEPLLPAHTAGRKRVRLNVKNAQYRNRSGKIDIIYIRRSKGIHAWVSIGKGKNNCLLLTVRDETQLFFITKGKCSSPFYVEELQCVPFSSQQHSVLPTQMKRLNDKSGTVSLNWE